jgi:hypothetical protein
VPSRNQPARPHPKLHVERMPSESIPDLHPRQRPRPRLRPRLRSRLRRCLARRSRHCLHGLNLSTRPPRTGLSGTRRPTPVESQGNGPAPGSPCTRCPRSRSEGTRIAQHEMLGKPPTKNVRPAGPPRNSD